MDDPKSNATAIGSYYPPEEESNDTGSGEVETGETVVATTSDRVQNEPFGDETSAEVKYRTMHWWQASMIMVAETISLGILSLPAALAAVGLVPGIILILGLGVVATYTGYTLGQFKLAYPHIHNMADAGEVLGGPILREILGTGQMVFYIFVMGSHILTFSIMMNVLTDRGTCTIVFGALGTLVCLVCTLPRTLKKVSVLAMVSWASIFAAVLVTMIGIGVEKPGKGHVQATAKTNLHDGFLAVTNIIFAYAGHVTFLPIISELHTPIHYPRALYLLQAIDISMYLLAAVVIYAYSAPHPSSPALSTLPPTLRKIAYGIAIPTIVVAGVINGHVAAKYIFVRLCQHHHHHHHHHHNNNNDNPASSTRTITTTLLSSRSWRSSALWTAIVSTLWAAAWVVAAGIPVFEQLLGLMSALFCSWFTYGLSGVFWLFLQRRGWCPEGGRGLERRTRRTRTRRGGEWWWWWGEGKVKVVLLAGVNWGVVVMGGVICGLGLYASGTVIHSSSGKEAFTCADTSQG